MASEPLTVLSWNLSDFELTSPAGPAADHRQAEQLAHIAELAPDILCCQKLSGEHTPDRVVDGFERFAATLGMSGRIPLRPSPGCTWACCGVPAAPRSGRGSRAAGSSNAMPGSRSWT